MTDEMVPRKVAEAMAQLGVAKVREIEGLVAGLAPIIAERIEASIAKAIEPLARRIDELEARPSLKYCGVWDENTQFNEGDFVTDHGALWHCKASTRARPGTSGDWQLAVKRGRAG